MPGKKGEKTPTGSSDKQPAFTVGFAILRQPRGDEKARQIVYFRIRDHMRRMGMARRGIYKLIDDEAETGLDLYPMPKNALQSDDEASRAVFRDLYRGVRTEFELKKAGERGSAR